jgi:hypothetical protein
MIDPNEPAFPTQMVATRRDGSLLFLSDYFPTGCGMTKRELFAAMAMQGLLPNWEAPPAVLHERLAQHAVASADALLAELAKPTK